MNLFKPEIETTAQRQDRERDQARFDYFKDEILLNNGAIDWNAEWANYQSTSINTIVKAQLEHTVKSMMQSPEYQLF